MNPPSIALRSKRIFYSANQLGINVLWYAFNTVAVFFYVSDMHVSGVMLSVAMIVFGFVNAFLNLFAGYVSDRTQTRWGRRIPYIAATGLPFGLAFFFLFSPPALHGSALLTYFLVLTLLFDAAFTFNALNIGSLFPEMFQETKIRAQVAALMQVFGIVGLLIGVALSKSLGQTLGWPLMALLFGAIGVITIYVSLLGSHEDPQYRADAAFSFRPAFVETFRNRAFVFYVIASFLIQLSTTLFTTVTSFYTQFVVPVSPIDNSLFLGGVFVVALPVAFIWARVTIRIGATRSTIISAIWYAVAMLGLLIDRSALMLILNGLILGVAVSGFLVLINILLADVIDYDATRTGRRREGMYLGINGFIIRIGLSVNYLIMALYFSLSGYNSHAVVQTASAVMGLRIVAGALPVVLMGAAVFFLGKYRRVIKTPIPLSAAVSEGTLTGL